MRAGLLIRKRLCLLCDGWGARVKTLAEYNAAQIRKFLAAASGSIWTFHRRGDQQPALSSPFRPGFVRVRLRAVCGLAPARMADATVLSDYFFARRGHATVFKWYRTAAWAFTGLTGLPPFGVKSITAAVLLAAEFDRVLVCAR